MYELFIKSLWSYSSTGGDAFFDASRDEVMWNAEWLHRSQVIGNVTDYAAVESGVQAYDVFEITAPGTAM